MRRRSLERSRRRPRREERSTARAADMAPRSVKLLAAGVAAAVGAAWVAKRVYDALEGERCRLRPLTDDESASASAAGRDALAVALQHRGGLLPQQRPAAWLLLRRGDAVADAATYEALLRRCDEAQADSEYAAACRVIAADVPRTPLEGAGDLEATRLRLTRLLRAYALHDAAVGYAQGMSELAACVLRVYPDDEPRAFAAFAALIDSQRASFLADVNAGVCTRLRNLGALLARADAAVGAHLLYLRAQDCNWALRPMAVLLLRELGTRDALTLFDVLLVRAQHVCACHCMGGARSRRAFVAAHRRRTPISWSSASPRRCCASAAPSCARRAWMTCCTSSTTSLGASKSAACWQTRARCRLASRARNSRTDRHAASCERHALCQAAAVAA